VQEIADGLKRAGCRPTYAPRAILLDEADPVHSRCIRCDTCDGFPCLVHAKADAEVIAVAPALQYANVTLRTRAQVQQLQTDPVGRTVTRGVFVDHDGERETYAADIVVVACGAANSARLLLMSASDQHPRGLANGSDQVGRKYMSHNAMALVATLRDSVCRHFPAVPCVTNRGPRSRGYRDARIGSHGNLLRTGRHHGLLAIQAAPRGRGPIHAHARNPPTASRHTDADAVRCGAPIAAEPALPLVAGPLGARGSKHRPVDRPGLPDRHALGPAGRSRHRVDPGRLHPDGLVRPVSCRPGLQAGCLSGTEEQEGRQPQIGKCRDADDPGQRRCGVPALVVDAGQQHIDQQPAADEGGMLKCR